MEHLCNTVSQARERLKKPIFGDPECIRAIRILELLAEIREKQNEAWDLGMETWECRSERQLETASYEELLDELGALEERCSFSRGVW